MEEVHLPCTDLTNAAAPVTCGQAIDVPDFTANSDGFIPLGTVPGSVLLGIIAAKMDTPGAIISGWFTGNCFQYLCETFQSTLLISRCEKAHYTRE